MYSASPWAKVLGQMMSVLPRSSQVAPPSTLTRTSVWLGMVSVCGLARNHS